MTTDPTQTASPQLRTLRDWVDSGHTLSELECAALLDELCHGELHTVAEGGEPGCLDPDVVVVAGSTPTVLAGARPDPEGSVGALARIGWFALTGVELETGARPLRRHDVVEVAGPTLGPVLADALGRGPDHALTLEELASAIADALSDVLADVATRPAAGGRRGRHRLPSHGFEPVAPWPRRVPAWTVAAASAVLALVVLVAVLVSHRGQPTASAPPAAYGRTLAPATLQPAPRTPTQVVHVTTPLAVAGKPPAALAEVLQRDPRRVLQDIVTTRTAAVTARVVAQLEGCEVPRSPAWAADQAIIESVLASGESYGSLVLTVRSVTVVSVTGDSAVLDAVVDRSAYVVTSASGTTAARPAAPGRPLRYELVGTGSGWRLASVAEVRPTAAG
jgi:hypothetical protein